MIPPVIPIKDLDDILPNWQTMGIAAALSIMLSQEFNWPARSIQVLDFVKDNEVFRVTNFLMDYEIDSQILTH